MVEIERLKIDLETNPSTDVIIFGSGRCARKIASNLAHLDIRSWLVSQRATSSSTEQGDIFQWLDASELIECKGFAKDFKLVFKRGEDFVQKQAAAVIVAEDPLFSTNFEPYGLEPQPRILDIFSLEEKIRDGAVEKLIPSGSRVLFLCGWGVDGQPGMTRRMLEGCRQLQQRSGYLTMFLTGHLKVAAEGAEQIYQQAKRSGVVFVKMTDEFPRLKTLADGRYEIESVDETTRSTFRFVSDWVILDQTLLPAHGLDTLAKRLAIETDHQGFAQKDNVHRLNHTTNRRGIFVAGGARAGLTHEEQMADADQVAVNVWGYLRDDGSDAHQGAKISRGKCARCLTCHRSCPHHAVDIGPRMSIVSEACQSCGICMAACPGGAIELKSLKNKRTASVRMERSDDPEPALNPIPKVIVFGCARSAGKAYELVRLMGQKLPESVEFIELTCGGSLSVRHLLNAFEAGVDGVMVCTCHTDNCKSDVGNRLACKQALSATQCLVSARLDSSRLRLTSVAANMGNEFLTMVRDFLRHIEELSVEE